VTGYLRLLDTVSQVRKTQTPTTRSTRKDETPFLYFYHTLYNPLFFAVELDLDEVVGVATLALELPLLSW
jgi:hypothetical protein